MQLRYSSQARAERVVSFGRLVIALAFLISLRLDRSGYGVFHEDGWTLVVSYFAFALFAFAVSWRRGGVPYWTAAAHAVDVSFFCLNIVAVDTSSTPYSLSLLFPLFAASLLFTWKVGLATVLLCGSVYITSALLLFEAEGSSTLEPGHAVFRAIGYGVLSALVLYLRRREEKVECEIATLADWPYDFADRVPTRELLGCAAAALKARRLLMIWEERDEPWLHVAWKFGDEFHWIREAPTRYESPVHPELGEDSFMTSDAAREGRRVLVRRDRGVSEWFGMPLDAALVRDFDIHEAMVLHMLGTTFTGRLIILDRRDLTPDDLLFGELVARLVVGRLDQYYLVHRSQELAVGNERLRLSRDLHDGVLQSLTGVALQIEAVRGLMTRDPQAADERLRDVQGVLATDQRELRFFIRQLRPATGSSSFDSQFTERLHQLAERFQKQWGLNVTIALDGLSHVLSPALQHEIYSIASEAIANAVRHAQAANVEVTIESSPAAVCIKVRDDGRGFPFQGTYNLVELNELKRGPVTLKERVAYLGGNLVIDSGSEGARLNIEVPYDWLGGSL